MKNISLIIFGSLFTVSACVNDSDDYRIDKQKPYDVPAEYFFSQAEKSLTDAVVTPNFNSNVFRFLGQYWTETTYYNEVKYDFETRKIPQNLWNNLYTSVLSNLEQAKNNINAEPILTTGSASEIENSKKNRLNRLAAIELLTTYTYQILVDQFGNIPYTEANQPFNNPSPKYDDAQTIYIDLISRTEKAINQIDETQPILKNDFFFNGNLSQWKKFGNSLLIKLGIALADINKPLSIQTVNKGYIGGAILNNTDNMKFKYDINSPNRSPLYENLVSNGRADFVAADTFVNALNELNDPRRAAYFQTYEEKDNNGNPVQIYKGGAFGMPGNTIKNSSKVGLFAYTPSTPGILMEATEVLFYLSEAAARGGYSVGGSAENYYNQAITASFEYWNIPISDYLSNPKINYNSPESGTTWKEKIGKQAWIALYNRQESWNTKRRLDYPILNVSHYSVLKEVPVRLRYPIDEHSVNGTHYQDASNAIGGDEYSTRLFWDVY